MSYADSLMEDVMADRHERELQRSRHVLTLRLLPEQDRSLAAEAGKLGLTVSAFATVPLFAPKGTHNG
jgi:hypothetical protein